MMFKTKVVINANGMHGKLITVLKIIIQAQMQIEQVVIATQDHGYGFSGFC